MRSLPSFLLVTALLLAGCATHLQQKEQYLREAGFKAVAPSTPAQIAKVESLTPGHIHRITRNGRTFFVLRDPKSNQLLVGDNARYERYQQILYAKQVDPAIASEKADRMMENDWGGWDGMLDPMFFRGPAFFGAPF